MGFLIINECKNEPNTIYPSHLNQGKVCLYVLREPLTFSGGVNKKVSTGDKIIVPVGIEHTVVISRRDVSIW